MAATGSACERDLKSAAAFGPPMRHAFASLTTLATLLLAALAVPTPAAADHSFPASCTTYGGTCTFECRAYDFISVSGASASDAFVNAACGGAYAGCAGPSQCIGFGTDPATSDGFGWCSASFNTQATCSADKVPPVVTGPLSTPEVGGGPVNTPGRGRECVLVACVGPVDPIHVADAPHVEGVYLGPGAVVDVSLVGHRTDLTLEEREVGPIPVTGPPVPIVLCDPEDAPCPPLLVPRSAGWVSLGVTVAAGSTRETVTVLP